MSANKTTQLETRVSPRQQGFNLLELMIVIAIVAIASSLAIPSFNTFLQNNRIQNKAEELFVILKQTRNNAITTSTPSFVCRTSQLPDDADDLACNTGANEDRNIEQLNNTPNWNAILYSYSAPFDLNPAINPNVGGPSYDVLKIDELGLDRESLQDVREQGNSNINVISNSNQINVLAFNSQGALTTAPAPFRIAICDERGEAHGKLIEVNAAGQIRLTSPDPLDGDRNCTPDPL